MTYEIIYRSKDEMKDSGVEWIGMIPKEWGIAHFKRYIEINNGREICDENKEIPKKISVFGSGGIFKKTSGILYSGEAVLFGRKGTIGKPIYVNGDFWTIDTMYYAICKEGLVPKMLYYLLLIYPWSLIATKTALPSVVGTDLSSSKTIIPSILEQQKIANFLDIKTAQFNSIISKKEKLIEKLEEAKKSLISEVVTGKVKIVDGKLVERRPEEMKDSGVEWLGMIPKDWEVKKLKHIISEPLKYGANELAESDDKNFPRYIRITDFGDDGQLRKETFKSLEFEKAKDYMLEDGDILFARSGATVGKTFQFKNYNGKACFAGYLIRAVPDIQIINSDYLYYYTKTYNYDNWKNSIFIQATIQNIGADKYKEIKVCIPSINEQEEIVLNISEKIEASNQIISKTKLQIEKLKSAKQSLIAEAVTGKIDLRDWKIMRLEN